METPNRLWRCRAANEPPADAWIAFATAEAIRLGCRPADVLAGRRDRRHIVARWRAFYAIRQAYPGASVAGIARISGYHHASILHSLKRLAKKPVSFKPTWFPKMGSMTDDHHV